MNETEELAARVVETAPRRDGTDLEVATLVVDVETRLVRDWALERGVEENQ